MTRELQRIVTEDGSHSLYIPSMRETYHSTHGAIRESEHVFIRHGLQEAAEKTSGEIAIFEVGFGTGLNALLTAAWAAANRRTVRMTSIEAYPVEEEIWKSLNYPEQVDDTQASAWWELLHESDWNTEIKIHDNFYLTKVHDKIENFVGKPDSMDVIYFDAFAPGKQAEMWSPDILKKTVTCLKQGGFLVTYCAQGQFKRDLFSLGLDVEPLAGPPGKKEMTRGIKPGK